MVGRNPTFNIGAGAPVVLHSISTWYRDYTAHCALTHAHRKGVLIMASTIQSCRSHSCTMVRPLFHSVQGYAHSKREL